jgi:multidrug efflux pump subunit AcrA (membrane-fusion protein)
MQTFVSKPYAALLVMAAAYLTASCSRQAPVHASDDTPADIPTVAVAKVSTVDLTYGLVLTAEFKPYQEVDVMAKAAGFVKQINVDVGDRVPAPIDVQVAGTNMARVLTVEGVELR